MTEPTPISPMVERFVSDLRQIKTDEKLALKKIRRNAAIRTAVLCGIMVPVIAATRKK